MTLHAMLIALGFFVLIKGAGWLVEGGSALARKHNIPELAIGLTIVAFGTSTPEFVVNTFAAYQAHADIVFGNVIGSNIFNIFAVLGIAGILFPIRVQSGTVWKEIPLSLLAALLLFFLANRFISETERLSRWDGLILLLFFALFLYYVFRQLKNDRTIQEVKHKELSNLKIWSFITLGLACLIAGGRLVVENSILIATDLGVREKIIALTIVAVGTSLPELATSVVAALKKNNDIAVGNIIGSNIFNIFFILAVSALVRPIEYNSKFNTDLYLSVLGTSLLFVFMFTGKRWKLERWEAGILLLIYIGYTLYLVNIE